MLIKKFKLFLENKLDKDDLDDVLDLFIEISDLENSTFQIRNSDGTKYKKVHRINGNITKKGNIVINVYCDYLYNYAIKNQIKDDIIPRLSEYGWKLISIKTSDSGDFIIHKIPTSSGGIYNDRSSIIKISILINKNEN
jgi:hypothetical protein